MELPSVDEEFLPPDVTVDMPPRTIFEVGSGQGQDEGLVVVNPSHFLP